MWAFLPLHLILFRMYLLPLSTLFSITRRCISPLKWISSNWHSIQNSRARFSLSAGVCFICLYLILTSSLILFLTILNFFLAAIQQEALEHAFNSILFQLWLFKDQGLEHSFTPLKHRSYLTLSIHSKISSLFPRLTLSKSKLFSPLLRDHSILVDCSGLSLKVRKAVQSVSGWGSPSCLLKSASLVLLKAKRI